MKAARLVWATTAALLMASVQALPQTVSSTNCSTRVQCAYGQQLQDLLAHPASSDALDALIAVERVPASFVTALAADSAFDNVVNAWEQARVDKQTGVTAPSSGTTDLVSRPSTSELLGLAVQLGALTQTVSGNTATFQGNADGIYRALVKVPVVCLVCSGTPVLKNLNLSASFDLSQQTFKSINTSGPANPSTPAVTTVQLPESSRQLSVFTARYDIYNPLDPRSKQFKQAWATAYTGHQADLQSAAKDLLDSLGPVLDGFAKNPERKEYQALQDKYGQIIKQAAAKNDSKALINAFEEYFNKVVQLVRAKMPDFDQKVSLAVVALARYSQLNYQVVQEARGKPQFTFEYSYHRPPSQPDTHDFRLVFGLNPAHGSGLLTLNAAGTLYGGSIPAGAGYGRFRDFQISGQFDRPLGDDINHPATLSLAGYVQYQFDPSVLNIGTSNLVPGTNIALPGNAQVLLGTKGTLAIVQGKVTFNLKSGVNIPIGVSWANKTDLLNATDVRGNIGITYDFASIGQLLTGHSQ
jgi:hypothetical protein